MTEQQPLPPPPDDYKPTSPDEETPINKRENRVNKIETTSPAKPAIDREKVLKRVLRSIDNPNNQAVRALVSGENEDVESGNYIERTGRIFDGDTYRLLGQLYFLQSIGCDKREIDNMRLALMNPTIGFCSEIPEGGLRGEIIDLYTRQTKAKPEQAAPSSGIVKSNQPAQENIQQ
jgi:hypothetical protein